MKLDIKMEFTTSKLFPKNKENLMLVVKKFGGTSVGNPDRIQSVALRCAKDYKAGKEVVVVLSAMGKVTDELIALAGKINENPSKREMDMLLSTGEQTSAALLAMALDAIEIPAISLNAYQVPMLTTSDYGNAKLRRIDTGRIRRELESRKVVIITGFQGLNKLDDITTLGRGGSDTTAVALAASLHADVCEIFTDVDGVYTADPRLVSNAKKLQEISYDEMLELASLGAQVLHNRSVELAKKYGVEVIVRSGILNTEGTIVKEETNVENMMVSGVAADLNTAKITVTGLKDEPGSAFRLFDLLANNSINVDAILQTGGQHGKHEITFIVARNFTKKVVALIEENKSKLKIESVESDETVAKISVVGAGIQSNPGMAARMFEALYNAGINILMIATSEIRITVIVNEKDMEKAVRTVHDALVD